MNAITRFFQFWEPWLYTRTHSKNFLEAQLWTPKNHPGLFLFLITTWHLANAMLSWIRLCKRPLLSIWWCLLQYHTNWSSKNSVCNCTNPNPQIIGLVTGPKTIASLFIPNECLCLTISEFLGVINICCNSIIISISKVIIHYEPPKWSIHISLL
jgi:hypothetical protein